METSYVPASYQMSQYNSQQGYQPVPMLSYLPNQPGFGSRGQVATSKWVLVFYIILIVVVIGGGLYLFVQMQPKTQQTDVRKPQTTDTPPSPQPEKPKPRVIRLNGAYTQNKTSWASMDVQVFESQEGGMYVYKASDVVKDIDGYYNFEARSIMAWPNEGLTQIMKKYINKDAVTMLGTFTSDRSAFPVALSPLVVPEASLYFAGFWYIKEPKTDSEIKAVQSKQLVLLAVQ